MAPHVMYIDNNRHANMMIGLFSILSMVKSMSVGMAWITSPPGCLRCIPFEDKAVLTKVRVCCVQWKRQLLDNHQ